MKKRIQVFTDGSQALIKGDMDIEFMSRELAEEYEVEMKDEEFEELMKKPNDVKISKIKSKRKVRSERKLSNNIKEALKI